MKDSGIFSNLVTGMIMLAILFLISLGLVFVFLGPSWIHLIVGLAMIALGLTILVTGYKTFPADPPTIGAITVRDRIYKSRGKTPTVNGTVFLCNWPLIWISSISIEYTWVEMEFPVTILSKDKIPLEGRVRIRARVDRNETDIYVSNGKDHTTRWKYIQEEMEGVVDNVARRFTRTRMANSIMQRSQELSDCVEDAISEKNDGTRKLRADLFKERTFGIEIDRVQLTFSLPDDVLDSYTQKEARIIEYRSDLEAAKELKAAAEARGEILSMDESLDRVNTLRRIRDGKDNRLEILTGGQSRVGTVVFPKANVNVGGGGNQQKKS
ncbi:MAG: hypothetical protein KGI66_00810 [Patescibacteria group bacterium]|nr:hypothetical protein [Patescibacteria group bacterium]